MFSVWDNFQPGFYKRLLRLYLPLLFIGTSGLVWFGISASPDAHAAPASPVNKVVYSGSYTSPAALPTKPPQATCRPDAGFSTAGPIAFQPGAAGLKEQFDSAYSHYMYGYSASQLAALSRLCPLLVQGDNQPYINAYTSYWVGWHYDYSQAQDGLCRVSNVQVADHIRQALPVWRNLAQASPALAAEWQAYLSAVKVHEDGHLQLIRQYSSQLLGALQSFPPANCASIDQSVNSLGDNYVSQLKLADSAYESATQGGLTQGAIVP